MEHLPVSFYQLEVFYAVARRLSYSRAAEELYISQPAVSKRIQDMERALGVQVFERTGRRISLTDAGRVVYAYAQRVFDLAEETRQALKELEGLDRGYLRIGASSTPGVYLLPPFLGRFQRQFPGIQLSVHVANTQEILDRTLEGDFDLGVVAAGETPLHVHWQALGSDRLVLIAARSRELVSELELADLAGELVLLREQGSAVRQVVDKAQERGSVKLARVLEINSTEVIKRAVIADVAVSLVPACSLSDEEAGRLKVAELADLELRLWMGAASAKGRRLSPAALTFISMLQKDLGARLAGPA